MLFFIFLVKIKSKKDVINAQRWDMIDALWEHVITIVDTQIVMIISSNVTSVMWHRFPKDAIKR